LIVGEIHDAIGPHDRGELDRMRDGVFPEDSPIAGILAD
jgi:hypothetical protein